MKEIGEKHMDSELLKKLCKTYGPSGRERYIRQVILDELEGYADDVQCDSLGNIIAHKQGAGKKLALAAHMDQIGLMIRSVDAKGRFRVLPVGSVKPYNMIDTRIETSEGLQGIVLCEKRDRNQEITCDDLYVEFGINNTGNSVTKALKGQEIVIKSEYYENEDSIISGALDDRIGCLILLEVIKQLQSCKNDMYFIFSVQEENGFQGIQSALSITKPDVLLSVDVACSNDELRGMKTDLAVGEGAAVKVMDHFMIVNQEVIDWIQRTAMDNKVPYQLDVSDHGGTDACKAQEYNGIKAGAICVPAKNIHSSNEMVSKKDVDACVELLILLSKAEF